MADSEPSGESVFHNLPDWEIWACAQTIQANYGQCGPIYIAERIGALALAGDDAGVATWKRIAEAYDALLGAGASLH